MANLIRQTCSKLYQNRLFLENMWQKHVYFGSQF